MNYYIDNTWTWNDELTKDNKQDFDLELMSNIINT